MKLDIFNKDISIVGEGHRGTSFADISTAKCQAHGTGQSVSSSLYFHLKLYSNVGISWQVAIGICLTLSSVLMQILVLHFLDLIVMRKLSKKIKSFKTSLP